MKSLPRALFVLSIFLFLFLILLIIQDSGEADVTGWEFNKSRNLNHYIKKNKLTPIIFPEKFCDRPSLLVIMITTSPNRTETRTAIRETWGKDKKILGYDISLYFLLGKTSDANTQLFVDYESQNYKDIIQEDFEDTYNNLTIKSAIMLKIFNAKCSRNSQYLLKIDDDMYLSLPKLVNQLVNRNTSGSLLMGGVICGARPIRDHHDKWYAPTYLYPGPVYPKYISGTSYLMSSDVAEKIFRTALETPIFHLEDVYFTGICSKIAAIELTHNPLFTYRWLGRNYCLFRQLITVHYLSPNQIRGVHNASIDPTIAAGCEVEKETFKVHRWMMDNVLTINKTHRRRTCS